LVSLAVGIGRQCRLYSGDNRELAEVQMIDKILQIGAYGDLITPIVSMIQDITNGPSCGFGLPRDIGLSARDVERLLRSRGVKVWGLMVIDDLIIFRVRKAQAAWTKYLLDQAKVPMLYVPREAGQSKRKPGLFDWLDEMFGG